MGVRWSRMSWSEKNELWKRWRRGETLRDIAHALRRAPSVVYATVGAEGGIAPRPRRRSRVALTTTEREEISRQLAQGRSSLRIRSTSLRATKATSACMAFWLVLVPWKRPRLKEPRLRNHDSPTSVRYTGCPATSTARRRQSGRGAVS